MDVINKRKGVRVFDICNCALIKCYYHRYCIDRTIAFVAEQQQQLVDSIERHEQLPLLGQNEGQGWGCCCRCCGKHSRWLNVLELQIHCCFGHCCYGDYHLFLHTASEVRYSNFAAVAVAAVDDGIRRSFAILEEDGPYPKIAIGSIC